jgi:hypothetical protein
MVAEGLVQVVVLLSVVLMASALLVLGVEVRYACPPAPVTVRLAVASEAFY